MRAYATAVQLDLQVESVIGDLEAGRPGDLHHVPGLRRGRPPLGDRTRRHAGRAAPRRPPDPAPGRRGRGARRAALPRGGPQRSRPDAGRDVPRPLRRDARRARPARVRDRRRGGRRGVLGRGRGRRPPRRRADRGGDRRLGGRARRPDRDARAPHGRRRGARPEKQPARDAGRREAARGLGDGLGQPRADHVPAPAPAASRARRSSASTPTCSARCATTPGSASSSCATTRGHDVVLGAEGTHDLATGAVDGADPLAPFGPRAAQHVARTAAFPHCPDILVNSAFWEQTAEVAAFEELVGSHGGLGGGQAHPFLLAPATLPLPDEEIVGAAAVHHVLRGWLVDLGHAEYARRPPPPTRSRSPSHEPAAAPHAVVDPARPRLRRGGRRRARRLGRPPAAQHRQLGRHVLAPAPGARDPGRDVRLPRRPARRRPDDPGQAQGRPAAAAAAARRAAGRRLGRDRRAHRQAPDRLRRLPEAVARDQPPRPPAVHQDHRRRLAAGQPRRRRRPAPAARRARHAPGRAARRDRRPRHDPRAQGRQPEDRPPDRRTPCARCAGSASCC